MRWWQAPLWPWPYRASVAGAKTVKGTCATLSGNAASQTLQNCTDSTDTGGSGTSTSNETITGNTVSGTTTVDWASGKTSLESFTGKESTGVKDKCMPPAGFSNLAEVKEKGKVTVGTATDLVGGKTKGTVCGYSMGSTILVENFPGTTVAF